MDDAVPPANPMELAAGIVSAFVAHNRVPAGDLPALIQTVHASLESIVHGPSKAEPEPDLKPAVSVRRSVADDYIVCLEDGKRFKSLKRHLATAYGMTPAQYREKWGLRADYPMVAPAYAASRSALARKMGLGQGRLKKHQSR